MIGNAKGKGKQVLAKLKRKEPTVSKSGKTSIDASSIVEDEFGKYKIRAGRLSGNFVARAFPKAGSNGHGVIAEALGDSEDEAIATLKSLLGEREAQRTSARRWEKRSNISVPSQDEFVEALRQTKLSETQLSMLKAQALAGENGLTATALMNAAGYKSQNTAMKVLARTGALVADVLGIEIEPGDEPGRYEAARVLGFCLGGEQDAAATWTMHEELRHAVWATL